MSVVLGIDLGTSAVKVSAVNRSGEIVAQEQFEYPLIQRKTGYSEQNPEEWVSATTVAIVRIILNHNINPKEIEGISYSGQMHGLVILDENDKVIRPAILWNDTRTTKQCQEIKEKMGQSFIDITGHKPLEGFTLPKILWIKENEPQNWARTKTILLPKDYLRFRMTGKKYTEYSDASGTAMFDEFDNIWSSEICNTFKINQSLLPKVVLSVDFVGNISDIYSEMSGLNVETKVFAGAADNAAGALGAGILDEETLMLSIGTSGVVLKLENSPKVDYAGILQIENHAIADKYYSMGVTLSAGFALSWFKKTFSNEMNFDNFVNLANESKIGANGLIFTPYIVGERTPYSDPSIRGSFLGIDANQRINDFVRSVLEGIIFSFRDILNIYEDNSSEIKEIISIGGGAKSDLWLQIQSDILNKKITKLANEQGPGMGSSMIAAVGCGWFDNIHDCAKIFVKKGKTFNPIDINVKKYSEYYSVYADVYKQTQKLTNKILKIK